VILRWDVAGPYEVVFSTRQGGVSEGPFESLNLGKAVGDDPERVDENRRRLCAEVGADLERMTLNRQRHSATVHRAEPGSRGVPGDGLWSGEPGQPMVALSADCVTIAVARTNGAPPALAVLHAGWRGLLEGIVESGCGALGGGALSAAVGPAIGPCCYEVGPEVAGPFEQRFGPGLVHGRKLDLWTAAERALRAAGCADVHRFDVCTFCNPDLFFSERRTGRPRGTHGVLGLVTG
jgi:purine-nucleoside/S-methyl-5'-thioadenosine phosphorylase / adenosine deaminase